MLDEATADAMRDELAEGDPDQDRRSRSALVGFAPSRLVSGRSVSPNDTTQASDDDSSHALGFGTRMFQLTGDVDGRWP